MKYLLTTMPGEVSRRFWIWEAEVGSEGGGCLGLRGEMGGSSFSESLASAQGVGGRSVNGVLGRSIWAV